MRGGGYSTIHDVCERETGCEDDYESMDVTEQLARVMESRDLIRWCQRCRVYHLTRFASWYELEAVAANAG